MMDLSRNPGVDLYLVDGCGRCAYYKTPQCKVHTWINELRALRDIVLSCGLKEEVKWSFPVYMHGGSNVLMVSAFKEYACVSFFRGVLLKDEAGILESPGENTQSSMLMKFTTPAQVVEREELLRAYIAETLGHYDRGEKPQLREPGDIEWPAELVSRLAWDSEMRQAFEAMTPGKQRGYILHISGAKQAKTRESRVEKCRPKILAGKRFEER